jgi:Erythromycin esterase
LPRALAATSADRVVHEGEGLAYRATLLTLGLGPTLPGVLYVPSSARTNRIEDVAKAGFYGLDLYSLYRSIHEVISYLDRVDPAAAARARQRYACFDHFSEDDAQVYGFAAAFGAGDPCEHEVVEQLIDLQRHAAEYARRDGLLAAD